MTKRFPMVWTAGEVETLRRLDAEGLSLDVMAQRLGRSVKSVKAKRYVLAGKVYAYPKRTERRKPGGLTAYSAIPPRDNDCAKHLRLVFAARRDGFPVGPFRAHYRVAA